MPRNATPHEIADYLTGGYNDHTNIPYTYFDPAARSPIRADITGLDAEGRQLARWTMDAWEAVADVEFEVVTSGAALTFQDSDSGAYAQTRARADGTITEATINVSSGWIEKHGAGVDSFTFRTYLHEVGHVLGLGHAGPYNGHADYHDAVFENDSWQLSVMSYLGQDENPNIDASRGGNVTPMQADLIAIRDKWGTPERHYSEGDTIWGIGSELDNYLGDMFRGMADHTKSNTYDLQPITLYIEDHGGHDRIDFSHAGLHQIVDLRPGSVSSVLGDQHNNMLFSEDTMIEDFASGDGNDKITGNAVGNAIWGGGRNDRLKGLGGDDRLWGEAGRDKVLGGAGRDQLRGGDHDDLLRGQKGHDRLWGDAGADRILGNGGKDRIWGGTQGDQLGGQGGRDSLWGEAGSDTLIGGRGHDMLDGGDHGDLLKGQRGNDLLEGGSGKDKLFGGGGRDTLSGGAQNDLLRGQAGDDALSGGDGGDRLFGQAGDDRIKGGAGADRLLGGGGSDALHGGDLGDLLRGQAGDDSLFGDDGLDTLFGGAGNDRLDGGAAPDSLTGGEGADLFVFAAGYGTDIITDFAVGEDRIELRSDLLSDLTAQVAVDMARLNAEERLVLNFGEAGRLMLENVVPNALETDSFVIV